MMQPIELLERFDLFFGDVSEDTLPGKVRKILVVLADESIKDLYKYASACSEASYSDTDFVITGEEFFTNLAQAFEKLDD